MWQDFEFNLDGDLELEPDFLESDSVWDLCSSSIRFFLKWSWTSFRTWTLLFLFWGRPGRSRRSRTWLRTTSFSCRIFPWSFCRFMMPRFQSFWWRSRSFWYFLKTPFIRIIKIWGWTLRFNWGHCSWSGSKFRSTSWSGRWWYSYWRWCGACPLCCSYWSNCCRWKWSPFWLWVCWNWNMTQGWLLNNFV